VHPALIPREPAGSSRSAPRIPATPGSESPAHGRKSPPIPAQPASAKTGLSRRRSRVRVPSLPSTNSVQIGDFSSRMAVAAGAKTASWKRFWKRWPSKFGSGLPHACRPSLGHLGGATESIKPRRCGTPRDARLRDYAGLRAALQKPACPRCQGGAVCWTSPGRYPRPVQTRRSPVRIRRCPATAMPRLSGMSQVDRSALNERQPSEEGRFVRQPPPGLFLRSRGGFHKRTPDPASAPAVARTG
jgi:hypothetical protein